MTVSKTPVTLMGMTSLAKSAMRTKSISETRPVTATLACPAILDITFLKKLDMTSFTKKGLMAISKICGISLIKRTDDKKIRKRLKKQAVERVKKEARKTAVKMESTDENGHRLKVKSVPKIKVSDVSVSNNPIRDKSISPRLKIREVKPSVEDILYGHVEIVVAEPCKTCGRSKQPERFHSHPKNATGRKHHKVTSSSDESRKSPEVNPKELTTPKATVRRHSTGHLESDTRRKHSDLDSSFHSDQEIDMIKMSLPTLGGNFKSVTKKSNVKPGMKIDGESDASPGHSNQHSKASADSFEELKYVTGCYVCGEQMSPELRFTHEEKCIAEWRKQNSHLPPDKRKAEPLRPDFRFTETGGVDFEGTFKSIWANHMDSLVPCGKCNRTFFPERIEKHQACCTGQQKKPANPKSKNK